MWPERVPGTESANPTRVFPSKAPITCPPTLSATTNIRKGTNSASVKFQTSFWSATQARKSSIPWHPRNSTDMFCHPERRGWCAQRAGIEVERSLSLRSSFGLLLILRPSPERFEFLHRSLIRRAPRLVQSLLHPLEAALELAITFPQGRLGIDREITRDIHQNKKKIADLSFQAFLQAFGYRGAPRSSYSAALWLRTRRREFLEFFAQLGGLFVQFVKEPINVRPIKSGLRCARTELVRLLQ